MCNIYSGIDPGWTNLGFAKIRVDSSGSPTILEKGSMDPSTHGIYETVEYLHRNVNLFQNDYQCIERYVTYSGKENPTSEQILMLTGALVLARKDDKKIILKRAIDWKSELCKYLVRERGFRNPSPARKLDKVFSIAAAEMLYGHDVFENDHEADAACLAFHPYILLSKGT